MSHLFSVHWTLLKGNIFGFVFGELRLFSSNIGRGFGQDKTIIEKNEQHKTFRFVMSMCEGLSWVLAPCSTYAGVLPHIVPNRLDYTNNILPFGVR